MKKVIFIFVMAFSFLATNFISSCQKKDEDDSQSFSQYKTGLLKSPKTYRNGAYKFPEGETFPESYYLDFPTEVAQHQDQREFFSCVSFSVVNSIAYQINYKIRGISIKDAYNYPSASFIYNMRNECDVKGMTIVNALDILKERGVPSSSVMSYREISEECMPTPSSKVMEQAMKTRIRSYEPININLYSIKAALMRDMPVIIGAATTPNFKNLFYRAKDEIWKDFHPNGDASDLDAPDSRHSMLVTGFGKDNNGEEFLYVLNSWNRGGHNNTGYVKIST